MRKLLLVLTATLALTVAACGGGTGTSPEGTLDTGGTTESLPPVTSPSVEASPSAS